MKFKVGDVVVSKYEDIDIEVGERFTVTDVSYGGEYINFIDKVGDLRDRLAQEFTLAPKTLADVEVKEGMRFKVNLEGACPIQLAEDIVYQVYHTDSDPIEEGFLQHGEIGKVGSVDSDGDFRMQRNIINPVLFKYLELLVEPKELVKGKKYIVNGDPKVFLGTDENDSYLFSRGGLRYAVADGSSTYTFIRAQQEVITFLSKEDAEDLEEA